MCGGELVRDIHVELERTVQKMLEVLITMRNNKKIEYLSSCIKPMTLSTSVDNIV